jgi:hypothetical protein
MKRDLWVAFEGAKRTTAELTCFHVLKNLFPPYFSEAQDSRILLFAPVFAKQP